MGKPKKKEGGDDDEGPGESVIVVVPKVTKYVKFIFFCLTCSYHVV